MKKYLIALGVIVALSFLSFFNLLRAPFLYDDNSVIIPDAEVILAPDYERGLVQDFSTLFEKVWLTPRPLRQVSHRADLLLFDGNAGAHHAVNILFHSAVAFLGFLLLLRLGMPFGFALAVASIFTVNPIVVESLGIVSHRKEILAAIFLLLTLLLLWSSKSVNILPASVTFLLATQAKETAVLLPGILLVIYLFYKRKNSESSVEKNESVPTNISLHTVVLFFVLAIAFAGISWWQAHIAMDDQSADAYADVYRAGHFNGAPESWPYVFSAILRVVPKYLWLLVFPMGHSLETTIDISTPLLSWQVLLSLIFVIALLLLLWMSYKKKSDFFMPLAWIGVALSPYLVPHIIHSGGAAVYADRYAYLASFGMAWLIVAVIARFAKARLILLCVVPVAVYVAFSIFLSSKYSSNFALWSYVSKQNPDSMPAMNNLAIAYLQQDNWERAESIFNEMLERKPDFSFGACVYARESYRRGEKDKAIKIINNLIEQNENDKIALRQRAMLYLLMQKFDVAYADFKKAASFGVDDPQFNVTFAELLKEKCMWKEARLRYRKAAEKSHKFADMYYDSIVLVANPVYKKGAVAIVGDSVPHGVGTEDANGKTLSLKAGLTEQYSSKLGGKIYDFTKPGSTAVELAQTVTTMFNKSSGISQCVIMVGVNDAFRKAKPDEIVRSIAAVVLYCRRNGIIPIVTGPIPVMATDNRNRENQERILAVTNNKLIAFCRDANVYFINSRQIMTGNRLDFYGGTVDPKTGNHLTRHGMEQLIPRVYEMLAISRSE